MADEDLLDKVHGLGDLDLAALLCLISREHCIISTEPSSLDDLISELQLVASQTFGLTSAVVECAPQTTLDDLAASIQLPQGNATTPRSTSPLRTRTTPGTDSYFNLHPHAHGPGLGGNSSSNPHAQHHASHAHAHAQPPMRTLSPLTPSYPTFNTTTPQIANVILAKNLDRAPRAVQIQCLELLRTRRIFTRTSVQAAPKQFLFVAVLGANSGGEARLTPHLNDYMYIAHWHDPEDGFAHLEEAFDDDDDDEEGEKGDDRSDTASFVSGQSVVRRCSTAGTLTPTPTLKSRDRWPGKLDISTGTVTNININPNYNTANSKTAGGTSPAKNNNNPPLLQDSSISTLSQRAHAVAVSVDVLRYQMNVISFLRLHRAVVPGSLSPVATKHFDALVRSLAALHGLDYATPSLVGLAARKIYLHRVRVVEPERERSMQWGSDLAAVEALLEGVGAEEVVEDVLGTVAAPL